MKNEIAGIVKTDGHLQLDSIYIGIYNIASQQRVGEPLYFTSQKDGKFSFTIIEPGKYLLAAFAYGYPAFREYVLVPDRNTQIQVNIVLKPFNVNKNITSVKLIGSFCGWKQDDAITMEKVENRWVLGNNSIVLQANDEYKFLVDDNYYIDLKNKNVRVIKESTTFNNIYSGGEVIFDSGLYSKNIEESYARIDGFDLHAEFNSLVKELNIFTQKMFAPWNERKVMDSKDTEIYYNHLNHKLDSLSSLYNPYFSQMIMEKRIRLNSAFHPFYNLEKKLHNEKADESKYEELFSSDDFKKYYETSIDLLNKIDPNSILLEGDFIHLVSRIAQFAERSSTIRQLYNIDENFDEHFLNSFLSSSGNKTLCAKLLNERGSWHIFAFSLGRAAHNKQKAIKYFNILINDYPNSEYVLNESAERKLRNLENFNVVEIGSIAPEFELNTIDGKIIKLSKYKGKFVFLDFWGTWCGPCIHELPNLKKLGKSISGEKLQIIGIAQDKKSDLSSFLKTYNLTYQNVIANSETLDKYNITRYPTTFLISPEGKIIAKDLRGENIVEKVKTLINKN
jgi:peroxiredoxin